MKNVVVIPCYDRPEYLDICIDFIKKADGHRDYAYVFAIDHGARAENYHVIAKLDAEKYTITPTKRLTNIAKQSYNVLTGIMSAVKLLPELVFYIEDDVFIAKDFFTFAEKIHKVEPGLFCAIMSKNVNSRDNITGDADLYYTKVHNDYQGIGSCFSAEQLRTHLAPHYCEDYFRNPHTYVSRWFPKSALSNEYCEQDGLIRRVIEQNKLTVAFPDLPRCFHAGFYGYHRDPKINIRKMGYQKRKEAILKYAFDQKELSAIVIGQNLVNDSLPVNLNTSHENCTKKLP